MNKTLPRQALGAPMETRAHFLKFMGKKFHMREPGIAVFA
jgi:hypothetical protein